MSTTNRPQSRWALVLAAGKGTRFKSERAKVLHHLCGKPMVAHVLERLRATGVRGTLVVVGYQAEQVEKALAAPDRSFVVQAEQLGTGHAVMAAREELRRLDGSLLVAYGDTPLIKTSTFERLFETREREEAAAALLTCRVQDPTGYGRIVRDQDGQVADIVEERDATPEQKLIQEMNPGLYCFRIPTLLAALSDLTNDNRQGEYYLTDIPRILRRQGEKVIAVEAEDPGEIRGINDRVQLAEAEAEMRCEINRFWMREGITMLDPSRVIIDCDVKIGADTTLYPGVVLEGATVIGRNCVLQGACRLLNASLEDDVTLDLGCVIRDSKVGAGTRVGPFAHLRAHSEIGPDCRIGNYVEVKQSCLGRGTKAAHLTYLGDAQIGANVNIGAGVITCNYDGVRKHPTVIEDGAFIGSDCQLIAPVRIGRGAYVAAGSSICEDVPEGSLAIARGRQVNKLDWVKQRKDEPRQ